MHDPCGFGAHSAVAHCVHTRMGQIVAEADVLNEPWMSPEQTVFSNQDVADHPLLKAMTPIKKLLTTGLEAEMRGIGRR